MEETEEEKRIALIGIVVESPEDAVTDRMNRLLHDYGRYIIGRMGIPNVHKHINIISIVIDAPSSVINALSGKLGMIKGLNSKVLYAKI
ncbi:MAG: iron-only hydrogenase system regulator [Treponema sp.]|jgi:putative iron-only hydrogenase system regulator|nr:iron-only hydrogenase system regulator [Treponema sp.]